jgi:phospholipid/cholesterol/gamma-HCH transport system substrate-binding protein
VLSIKLLPEAQVDPVTGDIYTYELSLSLDSKIPVFTTDDISIRTSGLMGDRTIAITPQRVKGKDPKPVTYDQLLYASSSGSMEEAVSQITKKMDETIEQVQNLQGNAKEAIDSIIASSNELHKLLKQTNDANIVGSTKELIVKTNDILTSIQSGQGSLGKIIMKDDVYLKSIAILNRASTVMNDINHYGVLFHLDKSWQRDRKRRMAELARLEKPQDFSKYMNDEIEKIELSVSRVETALTRANGTLTTSSRDEFLQNFKELLNTIEELQSTLKTYIETQTTGNKKVIEN